MTILLLNAGSSSLKLTLVDAASGASLSRALADWASSPTRYQFDDCAPTEVRWRGHGDAVRHFVAGLTPAQRSSLKAVGHRVVHGGPFTESVRITDEVRSRIMELAELAPLHNPPSLETLAAAEAELADIPHVAVFDTAFHATLAPEAYTYPVPMAWTRDWGIRRYGFHGLSHAYCADRAAQMLDNADARLVICHLGHGCSAAAVRAGRCVDTTMGFTPLEGLMMATRSGSLDPSIILHVQQRRGLYASEVETALNRQSGLLGVSGVAADMRQVLAAARSGNTSAQLALGIYAHRVRQAIGALAVTLGGVDALVFTAGVGENAAEVRTQICTGLACLGLELDGDANEACRPDADIAVKNSCGRILVLATREDVTLFKEVMCVVQHDPSD